MSGGVVRYAGIAAPVGRLLVAGNDEGLCLIGFPSGKGVRAPEPGWVEDAGRFDDVRTQLGGYFAGTLRAFDLSLAPRGTPFQRSVWMALRDIPYGETISYAELATRVGNPRAVRAVGAANGRNPLPIVVPCHRVIGADGSLVGFGGGLDVKRALLDLERALRRV
ncbi:MAG: methylated-DNA--[protein]-cysteine S-methyltransferase [Acidobacteriota bacterium]